MSEEAARRHCLTCSFLVDLEMAGAARVVALLLFLMFRVDFIRLRDYSLCCGAVSSSEILLDSPIYKTDQNGVEDIWGGVGRGLSCACLTAPLPKSG